MFVSRENRIEIGVPALPVSYEIGLATVQYESKQLLAESLIGYQLTDGASNIPTAALRQSERYLGRLAESWTVSEDGRTITVRLREGVRSVAGKELDAEDVRFTLDRGFNVHGYYKWTAQVAGLMSNEDVEVVDRRTVRFHLTTPTAFFLDTRCFPLNGIFDADLVRSKATADDPWAVEYIAGHDAGYGPYTIEETNPGEWLILRARSDYYQGKPHFDQIVFRVIDDAGERADKLASGELDHAHGLSNEHYRRLANESGVLFATGPSTQVAQISLQCKGTPFESVRLRRAIAYALPYDEILEHSFDGLARPWQTVIPPIIAGSNPTAWPYSTNLAKARDELSLAGVPSGFVATILGSEGVAFHQSAGERIVAALEAIGLPAKLEMLDAATHARRRLAGDYVAALSGQGPQVPDAGYGLSHDFCSDSEGNDFGYDNPEVDRLVNLGLTELDAAKRENIYRRAIDILVDEVPIVPLASLGFTIAVSRRLAHVAWYPGGGLHFEEMSLAQPVVV